VPATKKPAAEKAVTKKTPAKKAAKQTLLLGPTYKDAKIDALVKRFDATLKAMSAEAVRTLKAFHANKLESHAPSFDHHEALHSLYPLLRVAKYAELHWELMKVLAQHHVSPTRRNENAVVARREKLLDHLDQWELEPLYRAYKLRDGAGVDSIEWAAYQAAKREQRRVRLGVSKASFAQLLQKEKAEYDANVAAEEAKFAAAKKEKKAAEEATAKAKAKAKVKGGALV
jgi:hypothetical protein